MRLLMAALTALVAAATLAPMVNAQTPGLPIPFNNVELSITPPAAELAYASSGTVTGTARIGCLLVVQSAPDLKVVVHAENAPAWFKVAEKAFDVDPTQCANQDPRASVAIELPYTLDPSAPGVVPQNITFEAHVESPVAEAAGLPSAGSASFPFVVAYHGSYTVVPSVQFPLPVSTGNVTFTMAVTQNSNAASMVMFEGIEETTGIIQGLESTNYTPGETKVFTVTYKGSDRPWSNATVSFHTAGHYLIPGIGAGQYTQEEVVVWSFQNNGSPCTVECGGASDKKSPAAGLALIPVLALAAVLMRRKA